MPARRKSFALVLAASMLLGAAVAAGPAGANTAQQPDIHRLQVEGRQREYLLRLPQGRAPGAEGWPLMVVFHGGGGDAFNAERMTGFTELGRQHGFVVVYPQGTAAAAGGRLRTWNAGHCCGTAMRRQVNDIAFVDALLSEVLKQHPVDPKRVYATGLSNGGMLVHRVAVALPQRWAAVAPVVAGLFGDEAAPSQPVATLIVNGEQDTSVPVAGGPSGGRFRQAWSGRPLLPVSAQSLYWAKANGCQVGPDKTFHDTHVHWRYTCPEGTAVERVLVTGVGHAWPGGQRGTPQGDDPTSGFDASGEIWRFFARHRRA